MILVIATFTNAKQLRDSIPNVLQGNPGLRGAPGPPGPQGLEVRIYISEFLATLVDVGSYMLKV